MSEIAIELMDSNGNGKMDKREFGGWKGLEDLIQVLFRKFFNRYRTVWRFKGHANSRARISFEK